MNPEIYGYEFDTDGRWFHKEQGINFGQCTKIAQEFSNSLSNKSFVPDFQVITYLNMGIPMEDIMNLTELQIKMKYDMPRLNDSKLNMYKQMIGAI